MKRPLYKTTIVIWSEFNPDEVELSDLAREAESGDAFCASSISEYVQAPEDDPAWVDTAFFYDPDEDDDPEPDLDDPHWMRDVLNGAADADD